VEFEPFEPPRDGNTERAEKRPVDVFPALFRSSRNRDYERST